MDSNVLDLPDLIKDDATSHIWSPRISFLFIAQQQNNIFSSIHLITSVHLREEVPSETFSAILDITVFPTCSVCGLAELYAFLSGFSINNMTINYTKTMCLISFYHLPDRPNELLDLLAPGNQAMLIVESFLCLCVCGCKSCLFPTS